MFKEEEHRYGIKHITLSRWIQKTGKINSEMLQGLIESGVFENYDLKPGDFSDIEKRY